jgi:methyl-accepting chemotaxis protein
MASELEQIFDLLQEIAETLKDIRHISHSSCEELTRISSELHELREMAGEVKQIISANGKNE